MLQMSHPTTTPSQVRMGSLAIARWGTRGPVTAAGYAHCVLVLPPWPDAACPLVSWPHQEAVNGSSQVTSDHKCQTPTSFASSMLKRDITSWLKRSKTRASNRSMLRSCSRCLCINTAS